MDPKTGKALAEFFDPKFLGHISAGLQVLPAMEYLQQFNAKIRGTK